MRAAMFRLFTRLAIHHTGVVLGVATLLTALSLWLARDIAVKTHFKDLLGEQDPIAQRLTYLQSNFPGLSSVRVLIEGRDPERLLEVGRALEERLRANPEQVRDVGLERPVDFFLDHGLLYLEEEDLRFATSVFAEHEDQLTALLRDPSTLGALRLIDTTLAEQSRPAGAVLSLQTQVVAGLDLSNPTAAPRVVLQNQVDTRPVVGRFHRELIDAMRDTPLPGSTADVLTTLRGTTLLLDALADVLEQGDRLTDAEFGARADALRQLMEARMSLDTSRHAFSPNRDALLVDVIAAENIMNVVQARPFLAWLEGEVAQIQNAHGDVQLGLAGIPVLITQESDAILDNFVLVTVLGFLGILAVFIIGFERVGLPSLSAIPLVMGTAWTFGLIGVFRGEITLFALAFPVLLFGLGIDFAIHILSSYSAQRSAGRDPEGALQGTFDTIGPGLLTGALTTAVAFLIMLGADFYGLQDMGFTAGVGVLMALLSMLTVLPALVVAWDRRAAGRGEVLPQVPFRFLRPVGEAVQRSRYLLLAGFLVASIALAYTAKDVRLDRNYLNMLPEGLPGAETQARVLELYGAGTDVVAFYAADLEEAERIRVAAEASPMVGEVLSPSALLPRGVEQKQEAISALAEVVTRLAAVQPQEAHRYDAADIAAMKEHLASLKVSALQLSVLASTLYGPEVQEACGELREAITRLDRRADPSVAPRLQRLDGLLRERLTHERDRLVTMTQNRALTLDQLPPALLDQVRGRDGQLLVVVRARGNVWDEEVRAAFLSDLARISPNHAGIISAWDQGVGSLVGELPRVFAWTCVAVALLVFIDLRSPRQTVLALTPLVVSLLWTLGLVGWLGRSFNIISVVSLPLLVGIGIDNATHLMHRIRHDRALGPALEHSGKPLLLTSLTTAIGFGSLMLSIHPGLFGLGLATSVGMGFSLLISMLLLPALVAIFDEELLRQPEERP